MREKTENLLTELNDCVLIIIDVQQMFLEKMPMENYVPIVNRISWLTWAAVKLNIPLIVTAEDIPEFGKTVPQIAKEFPKGTVEHNKMIHGNVGIIISTVKGTFYEWTRFLEFAMANFDLEIWTEEQPKGIYL